MSRDRQTVTIIRRTTTATDRYGNQVLADESEHHIKGCRVAPRVAETAAPSGDPRQVADRGRNGAVVGLMVYAPPGADVLHTDRARVDGVVYEVDGQVGHWRGRTKASSGTQFALRRAEG